MSDEIDMNNLQNNNHKTGTLEVKYEVLFDDADLKDTEDKFTSRDKNFNRLKITTSSAVASTTTINQQL